MNTAVRVRSAIEKGPGTPLEVDLQSGVEKIKEDVRTLTGLDKFAEIELFCPNGSPLTSDLVPTLEPNCLIRFNELLSEDAYQKEHRLWERQSDLFHSLDLVYNRWKTDKSIDNRIITLPFLSDAPTYFSRKAQFVVRDCALRMFQEIEDWSRHSSKESRLYVAGPEGVGKSSTLYLLSCLAMARHWYVIYIPRCAEWIATSCTELCAIRYFAYRAVAGLVPFLGPTIERWRRMLLDIIELNNEHRAKQTLMEFIFEVQRYDDKEYPILLVFDDFHALHSAHVQWKERAVTPETFPFNIAATFSGVTFQRAFKLISGKGESTIHSVIRNDTLVPVTRIEPWSVDEFACLVDTSICPKIIREIIERHPSEKDQLVRDVMRVTGTVPQQLSLMKDLEENNERHLKSYDANDAFTELLRIHEREMSAFHWDRLRYYMSQLPRGDRVAVMDITLQILIGERGLIDNVPTSFLDRSLIYKRNNDTFDILTPAAVKVILRAFNVHRDLVEELLSIYRTMALDSAAPIDLRTRSLKRIAFMKIIKASCTITLSDNTVHYLYADDVIILNESTVGPIDEPHCATLYIWPDREYEAMLYYPEQKFIHAIQIAFHDQFEQLNQNRKELLEHYADHNLSFICSCVTENDVAI